MNSTTGNLPVSKDVSPGRLSGVSLVGSIILFLHVSVINIF